MRLPPLASLAPSPLREPLAAWRVANPGRAAVAFSGGADSTALLVEQARWIAAGGPAPLLALHVHHGLQPAADAFVAHAQAFCEALNVQVPTRLAVTHAQVQLPPRASIEAQARGARYDALAALAREQGVDTVLLAQHADDQVETVLIALGRGSGVAGLAGMAPSFVHQGTRFARPLLEVAGPELRRWLSDAGIPWIDDPSNADERHTRNRLRRRLMPALEQALPDFRVTFTRSARLAHAAQALLEEQAGEDLERIGDPPSIDALRGLSAMRAANVLRHWLRTRHGTIGSQAQIDALIAVAQACATRGHDIHIKVGLGYVERDGDRLAYRPFL